MFNLVNFSIDSFARNVQVTFVEKPQLKIISYQNERHEYLIHI